MRKSINIIIIRLFVFLFHVKRLPCLVCGATSSKRMEKPSSSSSCEGSWIFISRFVEVFFHFFNSLARIVASVYATSNSTTASATTTTVGLFEIKIVSSAWLPPHSAAGTCLPQNEFLLLAHLCIYISSSASMNWEFNFYSIKKSIQVTHLMPTEERLNRRHGRVISVISLRLFVLSCACSLSCRLFQQVVVVVVSSWLFFTVSTN